MAFERVNRTHAFAQLVHRVGLLEQIHFEWNRDARASHVQRVGKRKKVVGA